MNVLLRKVTFEEAQKFNGTVLCNALKEIGSTDEQIPEIKKYYGCYDEKANDEVIKLNLDIVIHDFKELLSKI